MWVPAMVPWRATDDGFVTQDVLDGYARFAEGQPGVLVVEATGIRDIPSGPLLRIGDDRFVPGLSRLVETVREASRGRTRLFIQIIDFLTVRRRPEPEKYFMRYLEVTDPLRVQLALWVDDKRWREAPEDEVRRFLGEADRVTLETVLTDRELEALDYGYRERVWDLHLPWIRELPRVLPGLLAEAARRAQAAGFDGVELHYAHAYTMASFLSRLNTRTDGYGGTLSHRVRLPLDVLAAVRARVGPDYPVGIRYLGDEVVEGGSRVDDAGWFGIKFAEGGVDYLSVSKGGRFEDARQPKIGEAVYPYTGESGYECMPTVLSDARHKQVTCKLWDRKLDPTEPTVRLASDGKRRLLPPSWTPPSADWRHRARRLLVGSACALRIVSDQWRDCSVTLFVEGRVSMALDRSAHHAHRLSRDR